MAKEIALTPASIDVLQKGLPADLLTPGLAIEVLASGKKRWRYRRQVARQGHARGALWRASFRPDHRRRARMGTRAERKGRGRYRPA
jgi:hypothetical protein